MTRHLVDADQIRTFIESALRYASHGQIISLRTFRDDGSDGPAIKIRPVKVNGSGLDEVIEAAIAEAQGAADLGIKAVFCPPIAGFSSEAKADEASLSEGYTLSVECDQRPAAARQKLELLLGPATMVVASGGQWTDPDSGEVQDKLHLHWRLNEPATGSDLAKLKLARRLAAELVGADTSNVSVVHPIRSAGSWHRKAEPRLATIVSLTENEIELGEALELLRMARQGTSEDPPDQAARANGKGSSLGFNFLLAQDHRDVRAALDVIPNDDLDWDAWNRIAMATWGATGGSEEGFEAFDRWSQKSTKYDPAATRARWENYRRSPPDRIGTGTLIHMAKHAVKGWQKPSDAPAEGERDRRNATGPGETLDEAAALDGGVVTQDGLARVFAGRFKGQLRYCHHTGAWYEWTGTHWRRDERARAFQCIRLLGREKCEGEKDVVRKEVGKVQFAGGVERFAQGDKALAVTSEDWDRDPFLLGTPGGAVDLKTGTIRDAVPADGITKQTAVAPAATADCPLWRRFLDETFRGDVAVIGFIQRYAGYSLTGDTREHALVFGSGAGGNGKGVFVNTISGVVGDYATTAAMDTLTATKFEKHTTDLAMLRGARLVTASETEEDQAWAESRIKQLTGGDPITARFMRRDNFTFRPEFKLLIVGNHTPSLRNVDDAIRRRLNIVPFNNRPALPDRELETKLKAEWPGILRWLIEGCLAWQADGLKAPEAVTEATKDYFEEQDVFSEWLEAKCRVEPNNSDLTATSKDLFASWTEFARAANEPPGNEKGLARKLRRRGLRKCCHVPGSRLRGFYGVELRRDAHDYHAASRGS